MRVQLDAIFDLDLEEDGIEVTGNWEVKGWPVGTVNKPDVKYSSCTLLAGQTSVQQSSKWSSHLDRCGWRISSKQCARDHD